MSIYGYIMGKLDSILSTIPKFAELPQNLTAYDQAVGSIQTGDILLWQGNTLVIFYERFDTPYRYTNIGKIHNVSGLKEALGKGSIKVSFEN
ncbi:cyclophilin-like fold protein [Actinobacillus pleuropneumoniae]|uniref:cyclophilin-like fold protein n=1 Tax=Actinobacillus pleuropneumoniae TaxID=715 RepID=UPI00223E2854|nr:cyclophilin-like fold protein [Actinobacillus pleuropneumoniae]